MVVRKRNSCISVMMLTIFGTAYIVISVISVAPPMILEHGITFVRRSCMLAVFRSRIQGAASLQSFRSKTESVGTIYFLSKADGCRHPMYSPIRLARSIPETMRLRKGINTIWCDVLSANFIIPVTKENTACACLAAMTFSR